MAAAPPSGAPSSAHAPSGFLSPDKNKNVRNEEAVQIGVVVVALTALYVLYHGHWGRLLLCGGLLGVLFWYYNMLKEAIADQDMARDKVIKRFGLTPLTVKDVNGKSIEILMKGELPVSPTRLDAPVSGKRNVHIGSDYESVVRNPPGNILPKGSTYAPAAETFVPYDPTGNLYWAETDAVSEKYVLSVGRAYESWCPADKKPTFVQDTPLVSKTGKCVCEGYTGDRCQFSNAGSCHNHGDVQPNGSCVCDPGYAGSTCQYSDASTCNSRGKAQADGSCIHCDKSYGAHCETPTVACPVNVNCQEGCQPDGSSCNGHGNGCDQCTACCGCRNQEGGHKCTGCATFQTPKCVDHNKGHYPCVCDGVLWSGGGVKHPQQPINL